MEIEVHPETGVTIAGHEQELADLASALLEAAVLGQVEEHLLTEHGVATVTIRRTDPPTNGEPC